MFRIASCFLRCALLPVLLASFGTAVAAQIRVDSIVVEGNARLPAESIIDFTGLTSGRTFSDGEINEAVQGVMASGHFETAEIIPTGNGLRIVVSERPTVNVVTIEGNRRLSDDVLLAVITSEPRRVYTPAAAEADAAAIANAYATAARLAARVTPKIIRRSENRVDLVFEVSEGRVVENERISFVGNRAYSDRRLRRAISTKQAGFLRAIIGSDSYVPERISFDRQLLVDFYRSRGYVDMQILDASVELSRERDATFVTFTIREGQKYSVGEVTLSSEFENTDLQEYEDALRIRVGGTWSPALVDEQITRLERLALQQGFDFLRVDPRITRNERDLSLDIEFALVRGPRIFVERIDISGNQTTLDRVIRRQFTTVEGDPFNPREIRNAAERIRALGFFQTAAVDTRAGTRSDQVIVDVEVEEQPTGLLSFGGTYNDDSGFAVAVNFSERNFLGRGQSLAFRVESGTDDARTSLSFTEPAFLGRDVSLGFSVRHVTTDFGNASYDTRVTSISPRLGFPIGEYSRLSVNYQAASEALRNISDSASPIIRRDGEEGKLFRSSVGFTYTLDLLRGGLNPNRGVRLTFGQEYAGLGGDVQYVKTTARAVAERDAFNEEITLRATLEGGALHSLDGTTSHVTDRFFLSSRQVRGFSSRGIGPRDTSENSSNDVLGGNRYFAARLEAEFPLGLPSEYGMLGSLFVDAGSLWSLDDRSGGQCLGSDAMPVAGCEFVDDSFDLRSAAGVGLLWNTPIGPLRMDFSKPLDKNELDETNTFDITISTRF
ncbi:MAG: outer membrane protein assembly factor BamA [Boseongicola sp. SB0677_bin_26]|nr:outer membrane protein assembly factor BamA [Boseongicola sp. SB0665_bin_10]MYG24406.1 outer membrane protein assembly factor BamA [Boseongicola sp. SB0677_bin_26]